METDESMRGKKETDAVLLRNPEDRFDVLQAPAPPSMSASSSSSSSSCFLLGNSPSLPCTTTLGFTLSLCAARVVYAVGYGFAGANFQSSANKARTMTTQSSLKDAFSAYTDYLNNLVMFSASLSLSFHWFVCCRVAVSVIGHLPSVWRNWKV